MINITKLAAALFLGLSMAMHVGCSKSATPPAVSSTSAERSAYLLASEPAAAKGVKDVRSEAKDGDEVTLVGRIGGDASPWVDGQAAFLIVDSSLKPCNETDDDACETPWDYCCDTDLLPAHKAMVKVVDASGKTVEIDARELLGVKELQTVVVHGTANRDEAGNLTVLADGIYIRK